MNLQLQTTHIIEILLQWLTELTQPECFDITIMKLVSFMFYAFYFSTFPSKLFLEYCDVFCEKHYKEQCCFLRGKYQLKRKVLQFLYNFWCFLFKSFYSFNLRLRNLANKNKVINLLCAFIDMGTFVRRWRLDGCNHSSPSNIRRIEIYLYSLMVFFIFICRRIMEMNRFPGFIFYV